MNNKTLSMIMIMMIITTGIIGIYIMYEKTYGYSIENGTKDYLEAVYQRELAQKAIETSLNQEIELNQINEILNEGHRVCVTLANTQSFATQQKYVKVKSQIKNIKNIIQEYSKTKLT